MTNEQIAEIAEGLTRFQREAIELIGTQGEHGLWTSDERVNWFSVSLMMKKWGTGALLEGVPDHAN